MLGSAGDMWESLGSAFRSPVETDAAAKSIQCSSFIAILPWALPLGQGAALPKVTPLPGSSPLARSWLVWKTKPQFQAMVEGWLSSRAGAEDQLRPQFQLHYGSASPSAWPFALTPTLQCVSPGSFSHKTSACNSS